MSDSHHGAKAATRLLDPCFEYTPAAQTDIAATWRRYGFDPRANEQRRRLVLGSFAVPSGGTTSPSDGTPGAGMQDRWDR